MADNNLADTTLTLAQIRELRMQMARMQTAESGSLSSRFTLQAPPREVYKVLTDSKLHEKLTGKRSHLTPEIGGPVNLAAGLYEGFVMEAVQNRHLVLALRSHQPGWPENHLSTTTFMLRPGSDAGTTEVVFFQQVVPVSAAQVNEEWWRANYWDKMPAEFPAKA